MVSILKYNKENKVNMYIHLGCRNSLKNNSCTKRTFEDKYSTITKRAYRRSKIKKFDFAKQSFYCGNVCYFDTKHPDHNPFAMVPTKDTGICHNTLVNYANLAKITQNRIPFKYSTSRICVLLLS